MSTAAEKGDSSKKRPSSEIDPAQKIADSGPAAKKASPVSGPSWSLGSVRNGERFAYVDSFKGATLVSFREFYTNDAGEMKPGNKGISLSLAQFKVLKENWEQICEAVAAEEAKGK